MAQCGGADGSTCVATVTQISRRVNFYNADGHIDSTVNVTTNITTVSNSTTGAVVSASASSTATNVSGLKFNSSQLATIGSSIGAIHQEGASMSLGANKSQLVTAIAARESTLGTRVPLNPLKLSCSSGSCANEDRQHNIQGALNVLQRSGKASNYDPAKTYWRYNGVRDLKQRQANVDNFMRIYDGISQSLSSFSPSMPTLPAPPDVH